MLRVNQDVFSYFTHALISYLPTHLSRIWVFLQKFPLSLAITAFDGVFCCFFYPRTYLVTLIIY